MATVKIQAHPAIPTSHRIGYQLRKQMTLASAHAFNDIYTAFIAPLIPILIDRLSLLNVQAGFFLIFLQGPSLLQPVIGHLADRHNLKKYALWAPAITGIMMSLLGIANSYLMVVALLVMAGLASAILHAIGPAFVGSLSEKKMGRAMSIWMVFGEIGPMLGPLLVTSVVTVFSPSATPWLMIIGITGSLVLSRLLKDLPYSPPPRQAGAGRISIKSVARVFIPLAGIVLARALLRSSADFFLPVYLTERGASLWLAGSALTIQAGFGILGTIFGGYLNDRIGAKQVMFMALLGSTLSMFAFLSSSGGMQVVALALVGTFTAMVLPVGMAVVQEHFPHNRSFANGLYLAMLFLGSSLAGVLMGALIDALGTQQAFIWGIVVCALGLPFTLWLPGKLIVQEK